MVNRAREIERTFHEALDQPPATRRQWLERRCGGDRDLFERVEKLLRHDLDDDSWPSLAGAVAANLDDALGAPRPEDRIGPYRIIEELGHGGMGRVFLAEREDVGKRVAIKVVRGALASPGRLERFRAEQRILARLEHPGIAQLLDAGVMEDGTPYLVMDRIDGLPLRNWIEHADLSLEARLRLFLHICDAVTYAHGQLVVHRDIKPSNVMVTADGRPKLLDFGVARLLDEEGQTALTTTQSRIFTPAYASPEQLLGGSVTTATDVWQLGVLLYQMLTGALPFEVTSLPAPAAARVVTDDEPRPPSRAAANGSPDAARFGRRLRGDLDRICLKCLEKDPRRRYGSVEMLAEDVRRFLAGRPVAARAGGALYRARKFVRRHRVLTAAMIAALAWAGTVTFQNRAVARARESAERETEIARRVSDFLVDLFALARPTETAADSISVLTMVDSAAAQLRAGVDVDPAIEASMKEAIGRVYFELARYGEADSLLSDAVATRATLLGEDHVATASAMYYLGQVAWANGQLDRADSLNEAVLTIRRSQLGTHDSDYLMALQNQGTVRYRQARYEEAAELLTEALAIARELHDDPHDDLSTVLNNLANALWASGQREQARDMMEQSLDVGRRIHEGDHPNIAVRLDNLAFMSLQTGDPRSAMRFGEEALAMYRRVYPGPHHNMTYPLATIANAAFQLGDTVRADSTHRANVALAADVLGGDHPDAVARRSDHAAFLYQAGRYDESEAVYREVIPAMERIGNETHPRFLAILRAFASVRQAQGGTAEALSLLERAYETGAASLGPEDSRVIDAGRAFADALRAVGDTDRARAIEAQLPDSTST